MNKKLSDKDIENMRRDYCNGITLSEIAKKYNIHAITAGKAVKGKGRYKKVR